MEELSLHGILTIIRRRRKYFFVTASVIFFISLCVALSWSRYRSTATVQIEQSYVPVGVTTLAGANAGDSMLALADQRISHIEQKVTGLSSLTEIIDAYNLYPGERGNKSIAQLADKMRKKIKLELVSSVISNPAAAMKETAEQLSAIAFSLSFDYNDPEVTQRVVADLVKRFVAEDLKQRHQQAKETSDFLATQIAQMETSMAQQEKTIAEFRATHGESGPASLMFNQQANVTATLSIQNIDGQITANEGTQGNIRAQLATIEPYSRVLSDGQVLTTPVVQLKALESQFATLSAQYGPQHPDVIKARHQIAALKAQIGSSGDSAQLDAQIIDLRTRLATMQKTYGPEHPDVVKLTHQLKNLEDQRAAQPQTKTAEDNIKHDADNPAYLQLVAQLMSAQEQHKSLLAQREGLTSQQATYAKSIAENPAADQEMAKLSRDYDNARLRYRELKEKKASADMMQELEQGQKGQRLVVVNPPAVADTTHPARIMLVLGGAAIAIIGGISSVILAELLSPSVHSANHLSSLVGAMPLVVVPYIVTDLDINHPLRRWQTLAGIRKSCTRFVQRVRA